MSLRLLKTKLRNVSHQNIVNALTVVGPDSLAYYRVSEKR